MVINIQIPADKLPNIVNAVNPKKAVIGIGAGKNYTLYDVGTDNTQFVQAGYKSEKKIKRFGGL